MNIYRKILCVVLSIFLVLPTFSGLHGINQAQAASTSIATFFMPDDTKLKNTANLILGDSSTLTREIAYTTNEGKITIKGSFQQVTDSSLHIKVDQIAYDSTNRVWKEQTGKTFNSKVLSEGPNRFFVNNLQLFPGYNRVTISGEQNYVTKSDYFYILYEASPVIASMQLFDGNATVDVNEGNKVVTTQKSVVIRGTAYNADELIVNGEVGTVSNSGVFYTPGINLEPGLNTIKFTFRNKGGEELKTTRQIFYFDRQKSISKVELTHGGQTKDILHSTQTFTGNDATGVMNFELMVPFNQLSFKDNSKLLVNDDTNPLGITDVVETVISDTSNQPAYKLVTFKTAPYNLKMNGAVPAAAQNINLNLTYGDLSPTATADKRVVISANLNYKVSVDEVQLVNAYYLPNFEPGKGLNKDTQKQLLDGSNVPSEYYIMIESETDKAPDDLVIDAVPLGSVTLDNNGKSVASYQDGGHFFKAYKVINFPDGAQNLELHYKTNSSVLKAKVTRFSKDYVLLDNIYNGMVHTVNSAITIPKLPVSGQIVGFDGPSTLLNTQFLVNGVDYTNMLQLDPATRKFNFLLDIGTKNTDQLYIGENKIKFILKYTLGSIVREYVNEVKIYIADSNVPTIKDVRPLTPPKNGHNNNLDVPQPSDYLLPSPEFQVKGNLKMNFTTTLKKADYFLEGSGAKTVTIKKNGELLVRFDPSIGATDVKTSIIAGSDRDQVGGLSNITNKLPENTTLDYYGKKENFRIRINNLPIEKVGTHVYTVELVNETGAPVTNTLEIERSPATYRLLSPVVNVGKQIVMNKNFVIFDIESESATEVTVNGKVATKVPDMVDRFKVTITDLKKDKDNKIKISIKRPTGDITDTVSVYYASDVDVDSMYMEKFSNKHSVFNKKLELSFPSKTVLRRTDDKKIYPDASILFGIASPVDGYLGRTDDYGIKAPAKTENELYEAFKRTFGRENFTTISEFYWVSVGYAERGNPGDADYQPATGGLMPYNSEKMFGTKYDTPKFNFDSEKRILKPSERGTITLAFDPNTVEDAGSYISVFFMNDKGQWKNLGGKVDAKAHTITVPFDEFGYYMVGKLKQSFSDIVNHGWARNVLQAIYAKGLMTNFENSFFHTDVDTTRGEFAAALVRALELPINSDKNFTFNDVTPNSRTISWSYEEIETAARAGIISGFSDKVFEPGYTITREQAAMMIARALNLKMAVNDKKLADKIGKTFADVNKMSNYAYPAVDAVNAAKIMVGAPADPSNPKSKAVNFNPTANLTRAETGQIVVNILQKYRKTFPINLS
ncbi:S-layer homology domain-containing protein [Paenibacillus sp. KN14-4R]|uniref:S-layer homology domain-containing protein n=1 Tax=Paenibacillus sp. KN14-4R TaxID=3445773 RepID=UPI003F9F9C33